jgi:hypothetical protein
VNVVSKLTVAGTNVTCGTVQGVLNVEALQNNILRNAAAVGIIFVCAQTLQVSVGCANAASSPRRSVRALQATSSGPVLTVNVQANVAGGQESLVGGPGRI